MNECGEVELTLWRLTTYI